MKATRGAEGMELSSNRRRRLLSASFGLALALVPVTGRCIDLSSSVVAGGGGSSSGDGNLTMDATIGQAAAGLTLSSSEFSMQTGFWTVSSGKLLNISTRLRVLTGENVLIGGFIISGSDPKRVLLRGLGPSLASSGLQDVLADPTLELHDGTGATIAANDNWKDSQQTEIMATTIPPTNDLESAIVMTLPANNASYTAIVRGNGNATGVGLVEAYDLDQAANSKLANISTRGFVDTDNNVMIGGFIVGATPDGGTKVLVRAIGPSLTNQGVTGALQDTTLELHGGNGDLLAMNDDWKESQQAAIQATTIPPTDDRESAIVQTLAPGNYTTIVRGKANTTGVAVVEAYNLP